MKKHLIILLAAVGLSASAFGQGQVIMANNSSSLVTHFETALPVAVGTTSFQLYAGTVGTPEASLTAIGPVAGTSGVAAGRIANTTVDVTSIVAPGSQASFQIYAWQSSFATYAAAVAGGGWAGKSIVFIGTTSAAGSPPPLPSTLAGLYPGFTVAVPEPSTIALGILGAGSLLFLRRKK